MLVTVAGCDQSTSLLSRLRAADRSELDYREPALFRGSLCFSSVILREAPVVMLVPLHRNAPDREILQWQLVLRRIFLDLLCYPQDGVLLYLGLVEEVRHLFHLLDKVDVRKALVASARTLLLA